MTGVVSLTLINVYEITDEKKNGISKLCKNCCAYAITVFKSASHGCFQSFAGLREREIVVPDEKKLSTQKTYLLMTFSQVTVSPILKN